MLLNYNNVSVYQDDQQILSNINLTISEGEFVYVVGKVGSGKSTFLKTIYGELPIQGGEASVLEYELHNLKRKHLPELRRKLGIIFQDFQLLTDRNVEQNLRFVLESTGWKNRTDIKQRISDVLNLVGMTAFADKMPNELSGGEQQRIAIARAILNRPQLILADEPTGNLDMETKRNITELLHNIANAGSTVVMITHDDNLRELFPGREFVCADGTLTEVLSK